MRGDLVSAGRFLRSSPGFTLAALLVLTLGIGATTAIFSVVDAVVIRALPFDGHDRLVAVGERREPSAQAPADGRDPDALASAAPQNYLDWAAQQQVFDSIAAIASGWLTLRLPGAEPESLVPEKVTASFFDVLRVYPAIGRPFTAANEIAGRDRVAVLSDALWRRLGGDPSIVGRTLPLDDVEHGQGLYEVVGVMAPDFAYPIGVTRPTDIWIPYVVPNHQRIRDPHSRSNYLQTIARLKAGVSVSQAQAQMGQVAVAIEQANPEWNKGNRIGVRPLVDHIVGSRTRAWMLMLLGTVGIVLLIACANVANLILARAAGREREVGIRAALGASRWRLVRLMLVESLLLSAAGTAGAVAAAWWGVRILRSALPEDLPRVTTIAIDLRVLAAAAGLSIVTAVLFGMVPALQLSKPDLSSALKDGARGSSGAGRQRLRGALVVVEVALAVVLLVAAALFIGSFMSVLKIDPGFDPSSVLTAQLSPRIDEAGVPPVNQAAALGAIVDRIAAIPGVEHAALIAGGLPLGGSMMVTSLRVAARPIAPGLDDGVSIRKVSPGYHQTMGIPLRRGRLFDPRDRAGAAGVVILSDTAAAKYFPGEEPVGRSVEINDEPRTVIGIVGDVHQTSLETAPRAEAYVPLAQSTVLGGEIAVRTAGNPYILVPAVRAAVFAELPDVPLRNLKTMADLLARRLAQRRLNMLLLGLFGLLGLAMSAVGIYGVMAYVVSQRTREIGVRMALGATRPGVMMMVLRSAAALVAAGLVIGGAAAWSLSAVAKGFLFGLEPTDPRAYAVAVLLLSAAALAASAVPAHRAASVDPMTALRAE